LTVALGLAIHFFWFRAQGDLELVAASTLLGIVSESMLLSTGVVAYSGQGAPSIPPLWIVTLWSNFAITLNHSLAWLRRNLWVAGAVGALAGPAAYVGGSRLGAISLLEPSSAVMALALVWGAALPLLFRLALRQRRR
jgi:hypothetical protein